MRTYKIAAALAGMVAWSAPVRSEETERSADVIVYVTGAGKLSDPRSLLIMNMVDGMFTPVGVRIAWVKGTPKSVVDSGGSVVVHLKFVPKARGDQSSAALADTTPFASGIKSITVLCDRVRLVSADSRREPCIMAHIIAHELGHVLKGTNGHEATGVMKTGWGEQDFDAMTKHRLGFTPADIALIRGALNRLSASDRISKSR